MMFLKKLVAFIYITLWCAFAWTAELLVKTICFLYVLLFDNAQLLLSIKRGKGIMEYIYDLQVRHERTQKRGAKVIADKILRAKLVDYYEIEVK